MAELFQTLPLVFWPDNGVVRGIILLLILGLVYGIRQGLTLLSQIRRERAHAAEIMRQANLSDAKDGQKLAASLATDRHLLASRAMCGMLNSSGLAGARPADVLDPLANEALELGQPIRIFPNLLLLGGLFGTVLGIGFTLSGLGPQIQGALEAADPRRVSQSLGLTLQEMRSAFSGTLWGVLSAMVMGVLVSRVNREATALTVDIDRLGEELGPRVYPAGTEQHLASLQKMLAEGQKFYAETQESIQATSKEFREVLDGAARTIGSSLSTLEKTSQSLGTSLLQASGQVKSSAEELSKAAHTLDGYQLEIRNIYTQFSEMFNQSMNALRQHSDGELKEIRDLQTAFGQAATDITGRLFQAMDRLDGVGTVLRGSTEALINNSDKVHLSLSGGFERLKDDLSDVLGHYLTEVGNASAKFDGLRPALEQTAGALGTLHSTLRDKDGVDHTRHKDQAQRLAQLATSLDRLYGGLEGVTKPLEELMRAPLQLIEALQADLKMQAERVEVALSSQAESWRLQHGTLKAIEKGIQTQGQASTQTAEGVRQELERLAQTFAQVTGLLSALPQGEQAHQLIVQQTEIERHLDELRQIMARRSPVFPATGD